MANIIAPRRGEPIVSSDGFPTLRFIDYLESTATQSNLTVPDTEIDFASVNLSLGQFYELSRRISEMELLISSNQLIGIIAKMQKQIDLLIAQQTV